MAKKTKAQKDLEESLGISATGLPMPKVLANPEVIKWGIPVIDWDIFGIGGVPRRKITEYYGKPNSGKTTWAKYLLKAFQEQFPDERARVVDTESSWDLKFCKRMGINMDMVDYYDTNDVIAIGQIVIEGMNPATNTGLIIVDSFGNVDLGNNMTIESFLKIRTTPSGKKTWTDRQVADVAGAITKYVKAVNYNLPHTNAAIFYTNQMRANIETGFGASTGPKEQKAGGFAFKHNIQISVSVRKVKDILGPTAKSSKGKIGFISHLSTAYASSRSKLGETFTTDESNHPHLYFDNAYVTTTSYTLADRAVRAGVVEKKGGWYVCNLKTKEGKKQLFKIQGNEKYEQLLIQNPKIRAKVLTKTEKREAEYVSE